MTDPVSSTRLYLGNLPRDGTQSSSFHDLQSPLLLGIPLFVKKATRGSKSVSSQPGPVITFSTGGVLGPNIAYWMMENSLLCAISLAHRILADQMLQWPTVTKEDIQSHFSEGPGTIKETKLMNGFGFIEYEDAADARDVVPRKATFPNSSSSSSYN